MDFDSLSVSVYVCPPFFLSIIFLLAADVHYNMTWSIVQKLCPFGHPFPLPSFPPFHTLTSARLRTVGINYANLTNGSNWVCKNHCPFLSLKLYQQHFRRHDTEVEFVCACAGSGKLVFSEQLSFFCYDN